MTYNQYYRSALYLPIILPLIAWALMMLGLQLSEGHGDIAPPAWLPNWLVAGLVIGVTVLAYGGLVYFAPYLFVFGLIQRRSARWGVSQYRWALIAVPVAFAVVAGFLILLFNLVGDAPNPISIASEGALFVLMVGGAQALLIGMGDVLGTRIGWLRRGAGDKVDERVA
jgi:hypothetical protein